MSKKRPCGLDYCPQEDLIGAYASCLACAWSMEYDKTDRPQGKWIDQGWHGDWQFETDGRGNCWHEYRCSECGYIKKGGKSNYCPNCGAQMKESN